MRIPTRVLLAAGAATLVAGGGSALTASNTLAGNNVAGFATDTVTGATTTTIDHTLTADGAYIASTALTFAADSNTSPVVKAGFGTTGALTDCVVSGRTVLTDPYTAVCTYGATTYTTAAATDFRVAVS